MVFRDPGTKPHQGEGGRLDPPASEAKSGSDLSATLPGRLALAVFPTVGKFPSLWLPLDVTHVSTAFLNSVVFC